MHLKAIVEQLGVKHYKLTYLVEDQEGDRIPTFHILLFTGTKDSCILYHKVLTSYGYKGTNEVLRGINPYRLAKVKEALNNALQSLPKKHLSLNIPLDVCDA